jgi:hypothetical protein
MSLEKQLKQNRMLADSISAGIDLLIEEKKSTGRDIIKAPFRYVGYLFRQAALGSLISASAFCTYYGLSVYSSEPSCFLEKKAQTKTYNSEEDDITHAIDNHKSPPLGYHR